MQKLRRTLSFKTSGNGEAHVKTAYGFSLPSPRKKHGHTLDPKQNPELCQKTSENIHTSSVGLPTNSASPRSISTLTTVHFEDSASPSQDFVQSLSKDVLGSSPSKVATKEPKSPRSHPVIRSSRWSKSMPSPRQGLTPRTIDKPPFSSTVQIITESNPAGAATIDQLLDIFVAQLEYSTEVTEADCAIFLFMLPGFADPQDVLVILMKRLAAEVAIAKLLRVWLQNLERDFPID